jgi:hypothetical protein
MKYIKTLILFPIVFITFSCHTEKEFSTIFYNKKIEVTADSLCGEYANRKSKLMDGTYKILSKPVFFYEGLHFRWPYGNYTIKSYKNGKLEGESQTYKKHKIQSIEHYHKGLLNGEYISCSNGIKDFQLTYQNGLPNGKEIFFEENGVDTSYFNTYRTTPDSMIVYLDHKYSFDVQYIDDMNYKLQFKCCLLKADKYPVRYYMFNDSSFIVEKIWLRADPYCYKSMDD